MPEPTVSAASLEGILREELGTMDMTSTSANKFEQLRLRASATLGLEAADLAVKALASPKNYGNRISEATRRPLEVLILVSQEAVDRRALLARFGDRAIFHPATLVVELNAGTPRCWIVVGQGAPPDPFPGNYERLSVSLTPTTAPSPEVVAEIVERLCALQKQPIALLDALTDELPPALRVIPSLKRVGGTRNTHNRIAEGLGRKPAILVLLAATTLEPALERAVNDLLGSGTGNPRVLFALHDSATFSVTESATTRAANTTTEVVARPPQPRKRPPFHWRHASYLAWNQLLLEQVFEESDESSGPVMRIAATPSELARMVGETAAAPEDVAEAFMSAVRREFPPGKGVEADCLNPWPIASGEIPHFIGILWLSCFVCWANNEGSFDERWAQAIGRRADYRYLNQLWERLEQWTSSAIGYHALNLPERDPEYRTVIGRSYFLAFPHGNDRNTLARVLADAGLQGRSLPVTKTLGVLLDRKRMFSPGFQGDLDRFTDLWRTGQDSLDTPFWRAVEHEASHPPRASAAERLRQGLLVAREEEDQVLHVYVGWPRESEIPPGFVALDDSDYAEEHLVLLTNATSGPGPLDPWSTPQLLAGPAGAALHQGVLLFEEFDRWVYRQVHGSAATSTSVALVSKSRVEAFVSAFAGQRSISSVDGFEEVWRPNISPGLKAPPGLEDVDTLTATATSPRPAFSGGIRVPGGHLWSTHDLPSIRAIGAVSVLVDLAGRTLACAPVRDQPGTWALPRELSEEAQPGATPVYFVDVTARARWALNGEAGGAWERLGEVRTRLLRFPVGTTYKPPPGPDTRYWVEDYQGRSRTVPGGVHLESEILSRDPALAPDLFELDPTLRHLGPGCGEMRSTQAPGHDWFAVGGWKNPTAVVFVGDPNAPFAPDDGWSDVKSDRTHWRVAFRDEEHAWVATPTGYAPISGFPTVTTAFKAYNRRTRQPARPACPREVAPFVAPAIASSTLNTQSALASVQHAVDHLAALACRQRGIPARYVQDLFCGMIGTTKFLEARQVRRGWEEAGCIDVLLRQDRANTVIVPRRPRFALLRDGPATIGFLLGLVPSSVAERLVTLAGEMDLDVVERPQVSPFTPRLPQIHARAADVFAILSDSLELAGPMWLDVPLWAPPDSDQTHISALRHDSAPPYPVDGLWDWESGCFIMGPQSAGSQPYSVECRRHPLLHPIYVVRGLGLPVGWTHFRDVAVIAASSLNGVPSFQLTDGGVIESIGPDPIHLPLHVARTCAVLGRAVPGPIFTAGSLIKYRYPFGLKLLAAPSLTPDPTQIRRMDT